MGHPINNPFLFLWLWYIVHLTLPHRLVEILLCLFPCFVSPATCLSGSESSKSILPSPLRPRHFPTYVGTKQRMWIYGIGVNGNWWTPCPAYIISLSALDFINDNNVWHAFSYILRTSFPHVVYIISFHWVFNPCLIQSSDDQYHVNHL